MSQGILIHWDVIADPYALLKTIVINKNIDKKIYVRKRELFVSFWDAYQAPVERGMYLSESNNRKLLLEIITEPKLFFKLTDSSKRIIEKEALDNEMKLFIPKYLGDFFTFGSISIGHLAYKKFLNWRNSNKSLE